MRTGSTIISIVLSALPAMADIHPTDPTRNAHNLFGTYDHIGAPNCKEDRIHIERDFYKLSDPDEGTITFPFSETVEIRSESGKVSKVISQGAGDFNGRVVWVVSILEQVPDIPNLSLWQSYISEKVIEDLANAAAELQEAKLITYVGIKRCPNASS